MLISTSLPTSSPSLPSSPPLHSPLCLHFNSFPWVHYPGPLFPFSLSTLLRYFPNLLLTLLPSCLSSPLLLRNARITSSKRAVPFRSPPVRHVTAGNVGMRIRPNCSVVSVSAFADRPIFRGFERRLSIRGTTSVASVGFREDEEEEETAGDPCGFGVAE